MNPRQLKRTLQPKSVTKGQRTEVPPPITGVAGQL